MTRVFARERTWLDPVLRPTRAPDLPAHRRRRKARHALDGVRRRAAVFQRRVHGRAVPVATPAGSAAPQSAATRRRGAGPRVQHGRVLHDEHELAVVRPRDDDELSDADGRAGVPQLRLGGGRHIALAIAFIRGIAQREKATLGNFWVDLTRASFWVLLPFCFVGALALVSQGVVQNLKPYDKVQLVDPQASSEQVIAQGPTASQEIIKEWGTNGGGYFNANSAHPFENPTPISNFLEMFAIFAISAGLTYTLGQMTGSRAHGWAVWAAMAFLFVAGVTVTYWAEAAGNPMLKADQSATALSPGGNMEGKETRFGIANSALFATVTTAASCGAVNSWHDSFTPIGGMVPLVNIMLGEVIFGGVGAGMYGILIFVVLSVFIAGLMVGRTPEYLGKKVEAFDVQMAMLAVLIMPLVILGLTGISAVSPDFGTVGIANPGPHGLSEILYAYTSGTGNNGSAFGGLTANTQWYNTTIGIAMMLGRFMVIIPMLALAGHLGRKKRVPPSPGTFPVTTPLFTTLLVSVILIVGALTFFPVLSLGPIVEHLLMHNGQVF